MSETLSPRSNEVLLVDVDVRSSRRLARLLADDGFVVEVLSDGAAAMSRLARWPLPRTLITELAVPSTDGETVARFARSRDPALRIIVLTTHPHLLRPQNVPEPMPVVMTKPLDYRSLLELLREPRPETPTASGLFSEPPADVRSSQADADRNAL